MIAILFELACFLILASAVCCIIPEPEKPFNPPPRPNFNYNLWDPVNEDFEGRKLDVRWWNPEEEDEDEIVPIPPNLAV